MIFTPIFPWVCLHPCTTVFFNELMLKRLTYLSKQQKVFSVISIIIRRHMRSKKINNNGRISFNNRIDDNVIRMFIILLKSCFLIILNARRLSWKCINSYKRALFFSVCFIICQISRHVVFFKSSRLQITIHAAASFL